MSQPIRAAFYVRVSTDEQAQNGTSLDVQRDRLTAHIEAQGWTLLEGFTDEGVSGSIDPDKRPALGRLLSACRSGQVDKVVVTDADRLSRDLRHMLNVTHELTSRGVEVVMLNTPLISELERQIRGAFAEEERRKITARMLSGIMRVAQEGYWPGGPAPFGFQLVKGPRRTTLDIYEPEATVLRAAVSLIVDQGCTTWEAAARLNGMGMKPRRAKAWNHVTLRRTLQKTPLNGRWTYARPDKDRQKRRSRMDIEPIEMEVPTLIPEERHQALMALLDSTGTGPRPKSKESYTLSRGVLKGPCGNNFHGVYRGDRDARQYRCFGSRPEALDRCDCKRLNADAIETLVWDQVVQLLTQPERLIAMAEDFLGIRQGQITVERDQIADVDAKVAKLEKAISTTLVDYAKAGLPPLAIRAAVETMEDELAALHRHRAQLLAWRDQNLAESERMRQLWALADVAHQRLHSLSRDDQATVLKLLNLSVTVQNWPGCERCGGSGRLPGGKGNLGGVTCDRCSGARSWPTVVVQGTVWDRLLEPLAAEKVGDQKLRVLKRSTCCKP